MEVAMSREPPSKVDSNTLLAAAKYITGIRTGAAS